MNNSLFWGAFDDSACKACGGEVTPKWFSGTLHMPPMPDCLKWTCIRCGCSRISATLEDTKRAADVPRGTNCRNAVPTE